MEKYSNLAARALVGIIFLMAGLNKIGAYEGTQGYMEAMGISGSLLPLVILLEVAAGISLIIGWKTRYSAYALAAFTVVAALIFHSNFADQMQTILFMKNVAIIGGLLAVAGLPVSNTISLDHKFMQPSVS